jgi:hypothetical protein
MWLNFNGIRVKFKTVPNYTDVADTPTGSFFFYLKSLNGFYIPFGELTPIYDR